MLNSTAVIRTDAATRYAKQLLAHLGHKVPVEDVDGVPHAQRLVFAYGTGTVRPEDDRLVLEAVEDVLTRHLERFGSRRQLTVSWQRPDDQA